MSIELTWYGHATWQLKTAGQQVLCTNPAALQGGAIDLDSMLPAKPFAPGTLIAAGIQLLQFPLPQVSTPWIESKAAFKGRCSTEGGASFLKVTSNEGTPVPKPSPDPTWGLHLIDANVTQGDILRVLKTEAGKYTR